MTSLQRKVALATLAGSAIEWYDFFIYGTAAALVFGRLFFPQFSPAAGSLLSFATFAIGWVGRPLGAIIAGHFGDRVGRKKMLVLTLISMGSSTTLIGLLPTYASIGLWAPGLLVALRIFQGLSVGGEFGGGITLAVEYAPPGRRALFGSFPQMGLPVGLVLGSVVFLLVAQFQEPTLMSWGWRIPFLLSAPLLALGFYIRSSVAESPEFSHAVRDTPPPRIPLVTALASYPLRVSAVLFGNAASGTFFYCYSTFFLSYLPQSLGYSRSAVLISVLLAAVVQIVTLPLMANMADAVGRKRIFIMGNSLLGLSIFPALWLLQSGLTGVLLAVQALCLGFMHAASQAAAPSVYADLFPPSVRYTGVSLGIQFSGILFAGPLPSIATALIGFGGGQPWYFAGYMAVTAVVSLAAIAWVRLPPQAVPRDQGCAA